MRLSEGVDLFNSRDFYAAHEAWEADWLVTRDEFLRGLIQLAAAYHHVNRGTAGAGAVRLFDAALRRLSAFPPFHMGVDREAAVTAARSDREKLARGERVDDFPKLGRV